MIFAYNIIMLIAWFFFNVINVFSFLCIYSLYLELTDLTKLQDLARLKVRKKIFFGWRNLKKIELKNQTESQSVGSRSVTGGCHTTSPRTPSVLSDHYSTLSPIRECPEQIKVNVEKCTITLLFIISINHCSLLHRIFILHTHDFVVFCPIIFLDMYKKRDLQFCRPVLL